MCFIFEFIFFYLFDIVRIEVIFEYVIFFFGSRDSERFNFSYDICNDIVRGKQVNKMFMFVMKMRVLVYVGKIEGKRIFRFVFKSIS